MTITQNDLGALNFQTDSMDDGGIITYIMNKPPLYILMSPEILSSSPDMEVIAVNHDGHVVVNGKNGFAKYKLCRQQIDGRGMTLELIATDWRPPLIIEKPKLVS